MKLFSRIDYFFDRLYTWRYNPLYQSGVIAIFLLLVAIATGTYLVFFYKVALPYQSVERIQNQIWLGAWIRPLHRYAADGSVVMAGYHMLRMFMQKRLWGARTLAWISGILLLGTLFFTGITGFMLVSDIHSKVLSTEIARLLDLLPLFSEPISSTFNGPLPLSRSFFFAILFIHISLPLGLGLLLWLHTSKLARPALLPPKKLMWGLLSLLLLVAVVLPTPLAPNADPHAMITRFPFNFFFTFWLPLSIKLSSLASLSLFIFSSSLFIAVPWLFKPSPEKQPAKSFVHEKSCTGCTSCYKDCPFDAIDMVPRSIGHGSAFVAKVDPSHCVSCGICAAACDPMGVGPAGRTGRDQIRDMENLLKNKIRLKETILVMGCQQSIAWPESMMRNPRFLFHTISCAGGLHSACLEHALKRGIAGIFIVSCPPRNCINREGPKWLMARLYQGHESSLNPTIDRDLVCVSPFGCMETLRAMEELKMFSEKIKQKHSPDMSKLPEKECAMEI
ncbi:MAG TPA: hypothetical protein DDW49_05835 [Deltaproteobacteria bacterium]|nr:MAG: hypothetical protein A2048_04275 [Deltaproteobacteria bacterium GWA2_45_12]HBF12894.1 hypothetical protein [Deltaproteobacteria bacterium]